MSVQGTYELKAPRPQVWEALNNPEGLRQCTPGCKELRTAEDGSYDVLFEMGIAAVKGRYEGKIKISDRVSDPFQAGVARLVDLTHAPPRQSSRGLHTAPVLCRDSATCTSPVLYSQFTHLSGFSVAVFRESH
jgi:Carbon monoxide dehydrogenase subunit G (CoxG)